ncbi:MAG: carbohydrate-binding protein [Gammaproteobacteria bacterium]|nr:MAG: carbohydrate-binding protein [Gammaproteobacteria bacterium]
MFKKNEPTRLGEVLLNKGLISSEQLAHAIKEQASRRKGVDLQDPTVQQATSLGEILIALGYIDQLQLKRGLNWQLKLRKMTIAMALCAPFMSLSTGAAAAASRIISTVPAVVQAEDYTTISGVSVETSSSADGGKSVSGIEAGDFVKFTDINVNLPSAGTYIISYRVASKSGGSFSFNNEGSSLTKIDTITVPNTGGSWVTIQRTVTFKAGAHYFSVRGVSGSVNLDWVKVEAAGTPSTTSSTTSSASYVPPTMASTTTPTTLSPVTVQGENYSVMSGVSTETTTDVGGGRNAASLHTGDWMTYTNTNVTIPVTGTYKITYRVASLNAGGSFNLTEAATGEVLSTVTVPVTNGWQNWVDVTATVSLTAGTHNFGIKILAGGFNLNWFKIEGTATSSSSSSSSAAATGYLSATIQAENYSAMSGVYNEPTTDVGGGQDTGNIHTGDWMVYTNASVNVPTTGTYNVTYRVASLAGGGSLKLIEAGVGTVYDTASIPKTGDWQAWVDVKRTVTLTAGLHSFGITAGTGGFNVNWFKIESIGTVTSSSSTSSVKSSVSSSVSSSKPAVTSSSLSSSSSSRAASSVSTSTSSSGVISTTVAGPVGMSWTAPTGRMDGTTLDISEIGGYEIRYKLVSDANFTYISINDAYTTQYNFAWLEGNYVFQVAAFDKNGVYSNFVDVVSD